jgi:hypothetical protein
LTMAVAASRGAEGTKSRTEPRASSIDTHDVTRYVSRTFRGAILLKIIPREQLEGS